MSRTIEVSEETYEKLKTQFGIDVKEIELNSLSDLVGEKWFFRTVTVYMLGRVKKQMGRFLVLEEASWIADTKRFHDFLRDGVTINVEVEPIVGQCLLNMDSIVDAFFWKHALPKKQQ